MLLASTALAKVFITNPLGKTRWQAGQPANVTWQARDGPPPKRVTIELYPATDATKATQRVVAVLADKQPVDKATTIAFTLPKEIPAWKYAVRMLDADDDKGEFSYSDQFLIADKDGKVVEAKDGDQEPNFPSAPSPKVCVGGGECTETDSGSDDPRKRLANDATSIYVGTLLGMTALIAAYFN